jgi:GNAT superfamily N-acetyltransferase
MQNQHVALVTGANQGEVGAIERSAELIERDAWLDLFAATPDHVRESLGLASTTVAGMGLLGCRAIPITELNRAMAVGIEGELSRDDLNEAVAWLDANATGWALQVAPFVTADVVQAFLAQVSLTAAGTGWAKFARTDGASEPLRGTMEVARVDAASAASFGSAVAGGFGLPAPCADWFAALVDRPSWHCFLAIADGTVAGGGTMYVRDDAAWLGIASTLPAFRSQGVQRSLLHRRIAAAAEMGARVETSETGQPGEGQEAEFPSFRNMWRAGFERLYVRPNFKRDS